MPSHDSARILKDTIFQFTTWGYQSPTLHRWFTGFRKMGIPAGIIRKKLNGTQPGYSYSVWRFGDLHTQEGGPDKIESDLYLTQECNGFEKLWSEAGGKIDRSHF